MKIVVIGDIHGNNKWKKIVRKHVDADKFIFIGDYFDSKAITISGDRQLENFEEILSLKRGDKERFVLLIGNHDYHYFSFCKANYGGYQTSHARYYKIKLERALATQMIQITYQIDNLLFSHAGISKSWCNKYKLPMHDIEKEVNEWFLKSPKDFDLTREIPFSPIWIRPNALENDLVPDVIQIVGHTQQEKIVLSPQLILIDTLNTVGEYLVVENSVFFVDCV